MTAPIILNPKAGICGLALAPPVNGSGEGTAAFDVDVDVNVDVDIALAPTGPRPYRIESPIGAAIVVGG